MKITLFYIGKPRSREANFLAEDYAARIGRFCRFEMVQLKTEREAEKQVGKALRVILDPAGDAMRSEEMARLVEGAGRDIAFFVGGADGFSEEFRKSADRLLSLSQMTLPHELARVILSEQIYRAFTILRNHPYPRERAGWPPTATAPSIPRPQACAWGTASFHWRSVRIRHWPILQRGPTGRCAAQACHLRLGCSQLLFR